MTRILAQNIIFFNVVPVQLLPHKTFRNLPSVPEHAEFSQAVQALVDFPEEIISNS